jgi:L-ribulose-5-phosphate 3-epimerase
MRTLSRRDWLKTTGQTVVVAAVARSAEANRRTAQPAARPALCFFSKHLPDLGWSDLGKAVKDAGYDGVDLTVRPQGHVLPERAADDLPKAIDAIKAQGVSVPMVTTDLTSASNPHAKPLLQAAARSGVRYFKTGYWRYSSSADVRAQVAATGEALAGLAQLARECGIELGFHNHAAYIGAALWDIAPAMDRLDAKWAGYYFDPRHAVAEGGGGAWKPAMQLTLPRLKMVALKDFFWLKTPIHADHADKSEKGWRIENCPMGDGMVDWTAVAAALRGAKFAGPISMHFEYEIPGSTPQARTAATLKAAVKDLEFWKKVAG